MTDSGYTTEQMEAALDQCGDPLNAAADELAESGYVECAAAVRTLADGGDLHRTGARSLLDMNDLDPDQRQLVAGSVYDVAKVMCRNGHDWAPGILTVWLEEIDALYGVLEK